MKLYQEKGYNPASGCLPLLIQTDYYSAFLCNKNAHVLYAVCTAKAIGEMTIVSVDNGYLSYSNVGKDL